MFPLGRVQTVRLRRPWRDPRIQPSRRTSVRRVHCQRAHSQRVSSQVRNTAQNAFLHMSTFLKVSVVFGNGVAVECPQTPYFNYYIR